VVDGGVGVIEVVVKVGDGVVGDIDVVVDGVVVVGAGGAIEIKPIYSAIPTTTITAARIIYVERFIYNTHVIFYPREGL